MNQPAVEPGRFIGWFSLSVAAAADADRFAVQLLDAANDPLTWSFASFGATVMRRRMGETDQFLFSPHAVPVFRALIESHAGFGCDPPRARELVPSKTSCMLIGFRTRWEPFELARVPAQGIPRAPTETAITKDAQA